MRCSRDEYRGAVDALAPLRRSRYTTGDPVIARVFTVAASEAIRRGYQGGSWSWDLVRRELALDLVDESLRDLTDRGLRLWGRTLRHGVDHTRYLHSLLAEGGLPLHLLRQERGHLRTMGVAILRDLHALSMHEDASDAALEAIVARCAIPKGRATYLHEPTIHALLGLLLHRVRLAVQEVPADAQADPAAWLSLHRPEWLEALPLDIEEADAISLVRALVSDASVVEGGGGVARVHALLQLGAPASILRTVTLPPRWPVDTFRACFSIPEDQVLPRRMAVHIHGGRRVVEVASLVLDAEGAEVRAHGLGPTVRASGTVQLELVGGFSRPYWAENVFGRRLPPGLPLVFAPTPDGGWRVTGTGAVSHPAERLLVVLPEGADIDADPVAQLDDGRMVAEVMRPATVTVGGERFAVTPGGALSAEAELRFSGRRHAYSPVGVDVWLGLPHPMLVTPSGGPRSVAAEDLEVRRAGGPWRPWGAHVDGRLEVRCRRSSGRDTIVVAPRDLSLAMEAKENVGRLLAKGSGVVELAITSPRAGFEAHRLGETASQLVVPSGEPPLHLDIEVVMSSGGRVPLHVPFPRKFSGFQDSRGALCENLSIDDLPWLRAVRLSDTPARPTLVGRLALAGRRVPGREFAIPIAATDAGGHVHELALRSVRDRVEDMLAGEPSANAEVVLAVEDLGASAARVQAVSLRRYQREIVPDGYAGMCIEPAPEDASDVEMRASRIDRVAEPVGLPAQADGGAWTASGLPEGAWLIAAQQHGRTVAQPALVVVDSAGGLRCLAARELAEGTANAALDPALDAQVRLARDGVAATHLPALIGAGTDPVLAVRALSRALLAPAPEATVRVVVDALDALGLIWESVPLRHLEGLAEGLWESLAPVRAADPAIARTLHVSQLKPAVDAHPHFVHAFASWYERHHQADPYAATQDRVCVRAREHVRPALALQVEALRRRHVDQLWPTLDGGSSDILALASEQLKIAPARDALGLVRAAHLHERPALLAPLIAALVSTGAAPLPASWARTLRHLRRFDPEWFSSSHRIFLAYLLGSRQ
jgi:hypothetical protein